ncbi:MAG TPA: oligosaccharide flippase family protein [Chitinophaga sp.]|uniref:oligosaccharide flippase family protein n=1 Tax=Chitinophaga sp. TaxID=1869181 RepID=UPI002C1748EB|nr:oligosaccharide flippase family protein [Chitinophaga sp.]HVI45459.1 oligosaccharide flippase family protein [Chitinophaga sp.]
MNIRGIVIKNIFWMLLERGTQLVSGILISALLARGLSKTGFGMFQYVQSLITIFGSIVIICGSEIVVPMLVNQKREMQHMTLINVFILRILASSLAYILLLSFVFFVIHDLNVLRVSSILGLTFFFREPFGVISAWLQARTYNRPAVIISIAATCTKLVLIIVGYYLKLGILFFALALFLETFILSIGLLIYYILNARKEKLVFRFRLRLIKKIAMLGGVFWVGLILQALFRRVDQLLLKHFLSFDKIATYGAAMQITENFSLIAPIIASSVAPMYIFSIKAAENVRKNLFKVLLIMLGISLAGSIGVSSLSPFIVKIIFGKGFNETSRILSYSIFISVLVYIDAGLNLLILKMRAARFLTIKWMLALAAAVITDLILIPKYNEMGAVAGYLAGYLVVVVFGFFVVRYKYK